MIMEQDDKVIEILNEARRRYENGGDINGCIKVYSDILQKGTNWDSFNYWLSLIDLYEKAGDYDNAFTTIQEARFYSKGFGFPAETMQNHEEKLCYEEFKIFEHEKLYMNALPKLVEYYVLKGNMQSGYVFDEKGFLEAANTVFKQIGASEDQIEDLVSRINKLEPSNSIDIDVLDVCLDWKIDNGL